MAKIRAKRVERKRVVFIVICLCDIYIYVYKMVIRSTNMLCVTSTRAHMILAASATTLNLDM